MRLFEEEQSPLDRGRLGACRVMEKVMGKFILLYVSLFSQNKRIGNILDLISFDLAACLVIYTRIKATLIGFHGRMIASYTAKTGVPG